MFFNQARYFERVWSFLCMMGDGIGNKQPKYLLHCFLQNQ